MSLNRVILLIGGRTYRANSFVAAAEKLGLDVVKGVDLPKELAEFYKPTLPLDFRNIAASADRIIEYAKKNPVRAVISVDDDATVIAARACDELDLTNNAPEAAYAAKNKSLMRERLAQRRVPQPNFQLFGLDEDPVQIAQRVTFPCVVKPILLSASQGVIRANNPQEFVEAFKCTRQVIINSGTAWSDIASQAMQSLPSNGETAPSHSSSRVTRSRSLRTAAAPGAKTSGDVLVENYIDGTEVAVEGILSGGRLQVLALFDKPDPLRGPYFEETIYVTPSRLPRETQDRIFDATSQACAAIGLRDGPIHAELRVNEAGVWVIEVAGRSIGGLCSKTLRFGTERWSLEELILRHAMGIEIQNIEREELASGVMMIPIPFEGILKQVSGIQEAQNIPGIEEIDITIAINHPVIPLPLGNQYLGFIFARADTPEGVEAALREAHGKLHFEIAPQIRLSVQ
jgi:biotin carboxylase